MGNGGRECGKNISVGRVQDTTLFRVASPHLSLPATCLSCICAKKDFMTRSLPGSGLGGVF